MGLYLPGCFITSDMTSEMRVLPSAWVSLVILGPLEPACAKSQNKTPSSWREAVARARPRSALPASAMASRTSVVVDRGKASNRLADQPINRLFTCRVALFSVIGWRL
jgi:hypothetical protein